MELLEDRRVLAVITVSTSVDELDGSITDGDISLRDAVLEANSADTIVFHESLNGATINLSNLGDIDIDQSLTINAGTLGITIDASSADPTPTADDGEGIRIFNITDPSNGSSPPVVMLVGLTLTGADRAHQTVDNAGGAIFSQGILTVRDSIITGNQGGREGGGRINAFSALAV